jgi:protein associated with RNAse G/E
MTVIVDDDQVVVIKLNVQQEEIWRYTGQILEQDEDSILIEARFNRDDLPFHGVTFKENDRFVERYYRDRWYNIFAIHDRDTDRLKAWYCNITWPAEIKPRRIAYVDLALDVLAFPDGRCLVLDEEEFTELPIDEQTRKNACKALEEIKQMAETGKLGEAAH